MHWLHYIALLAVVLATVRPVGLYLARVFERGPTFLDRFLCPVESPLYQIVGLDRDQEMSARVYICAFVAFGVVSTAGLFVLLMAQHWSGRCASCLRCRSARWRRRSSTD